jgi:putative methyltransferase (TIGR04325 family)
MLSNTARQLLDAPLLRTIRKHRYDQHFASAGGAGCYRGIFGSFAEAAKSAPNSAPIGYDAPDPASMYRERMERAYPSDYPMLFWLREVLPESRRVFDLGGHVGVSVYAYARVLELSSDLRWTVCDVPSVVDAGAALARERGEPRLSFTTSFGQADDADVLIAAGSLQYIDEPFDSLLGGLSRLPRHLLINKTPTHATREFVTLQNIGVAYCPYRVFERVTVSGSLFKLGYELVDTWENLDMGCYVPFRPDANPVTYVGHYLRLRA